MIGKRTIELPTQIPMVNSILPFIAIQTEVTCSAALATRGNKIKPMNGLGILYRSAVSSMEATTEQRQLGVVIGYNGRDFTHDSQQQRK